MQRQSASRAYRLQHSTPRLSSTQFVDRYIPHVRIAGSDVDGTCNSRIPADKMGTARRLRPLPTQQLTVPALSSDSSWGTMAILGCWLMYFVLAGLPVVASASSDASPIVRPPGSFYRQRLYGWSENLSYRPVQDLQGVSSKYRNTPAIRPTVMVVVAIPRLVTCFANSTP